MSRLTGSRSDRRIIDLTGDAIPVRSAWSDDLILEFNTDGDLLYVDPALLRFLGYDVDLERDEGRRRADVSLVHEDDLARITDFWTALLDDPGGSHHIDLRARTAEDDWRWVELSAINRLEDPDVGAIVGDFTDVHGLREAEAELTRREARFSALIRHSEDVIAIISPDWIIDWVSENVGSLLGGNAADLVGTRAVDQIHREDQQRAQRALERVVADTTGEGESVRLRVAGEDGTWRETEVIGRNLIDDPHVGGVVLTMRDIAERAAGERERARLSEIIEATTDLVFVFDPDLDLQYMNEAAQEFFLQPDEPMSAFDMRSHLPAWAQNRLAGEARRTLDEDDVWVGEIAFLSDGEEVAVSTLLIAHRDDAGEIDTISSITRDMTDHKEFEEKLAHEARHDPLTGLPNRTLLMDRIEVALNRARRSDTYTAVIFCDIDRFKVVNDSIGHTRGDEILVAIADRLRETTRGGETVARFGGDEFVIVAEGLEELAAAEEIASRLSNAVSRPIRIESSELFMSISIGIAIAEGDSADPESLISDADSAMYRAKSTGRGSQVVFDQKLREEAVVRLDTETALQRALDGRQLRIHYQPIVDLADRRVVGYEALLRWEHPERGLLHPAEFISVAEETGLIVPIGEWVVQTACGQLARWQAQGADALWVAVNLSARQLRREALASDIEGAIQKVGIPPAALRVEITEGLMIENVEQATATLSSLRDIGIKVVVDDFGIGYSSLGFLSRFPVDVLKIDKSLMVGLDADDPKQTKIVTAVVNLAHTLGLSAIGEGVENEHQYDILQRLGCDETQGWLLGKALPASEIVPGVLHDHG